MKTLLVFILMPSCTFASTIDLGPSSTSAPVRTSLRGAMQPNFSTERRAVYQEIKKKSDAMAEAKMGTFVKVGKSTGGPTATGQPTETESGALSTFARGKAIYQDIEKKSNAMAEAKMGAFVKAGNNAGGGPTATVKLTVSGAPSTFTGAKKERFHASLATYMHLAESDVTLTIGRATEAIDATAKLAASPVNKWAAQTTIWVTAPANTVHKLEREFEEGKIKDIGGVTIMFVDPAATMQAQAKAAPTFFQQHEAVLLVFAAIAGILCCLGCFVGCDSLFPEKI